MEDAAWQVVYEVTCPEVALGPHRFDIRHRALVVGVVRGASDLVAPAAALVDDGADAIELGMAGLEVGEAEELERLAAAVDGLRARCDLPIAVRTSSARVLRGALSAGAVVGCDPSGFADPDYLVTAAVAGASVVATARPDPATTVDGVCHELQALAERAEQAGIPPERVLVDAGLDRGTSGSVSLELLRAHDRVAALGWPLVLSASTGPLTVDLVGSDSTDRREAAHAAHALGIALGSRILRTHDVRGARRTADVLAAILEARAMVAP